MSYITYNRVKTVKNALEQLNDEEIESYNELEIECKGCGKDGTLVQGYDDRDEFINSISVCKHCGKDY